MPRVKYVGPYHYRVLTRNDLVLEGEDIHAPDTNEELVWGRQEGNIIDLSDSEFERLKQLIQAGEFVTIDESSSGGESSESVSDEPEEVENASSE